MEEHKTLPACKLSHSPQDNAAGQTMMRNSILSSQRSDAGRLCTLHPCRHKASQGRCAANLLCCLIMQFNCCSSVLCISCLLY